MAIKLNNLKDSLGKGFQKVKSDVSEAANNASETIKEKSKQVSEKVSEVSGSISENEHVKSTLDKVSNALDNAKEKSKQFTSQVSDKAEKIAHNEHIQNVVSKASNSLQSAILKLTVDAGINNPQDIANALSALTEVANDTVKYVAEQETKQVEINAKRDVAIAQINATTACIKEYLDKTFDERSAIFAKQFACVDEALRKGDNELLAMALNSINSLAASSPFKNLADIGQVQQSLMSGNEEWDI